MSWSPDGRSIVYWVNDPKTRNDLWMLSLTGDRKAVPLLHTPFNESGGQISPDGKWLAYWSDETGRGEVYVQPFPAGAGKWQVSTSGGNLPRWRGDGRELFYIAGASGRLMAVDMKSNGSTFEAGTPKALFDFWYINLAHANSFYHVYAVSADGQRFLIPRLATAGDEVAAPIAVVLNWAEGIRK